MINFLLTENVDYTGAQQFLLFMPGVPAMEVTIAIISDSANEPDETFELNLIPLAPQPGILIDPSIATVTITNGNLV